MIARPADLRQHSHDEIAITWEDGHESIYPFLLLREACPCAWCESSREAGRAVVTAPDPRPSVVNPVGAYAYSLEWEDGHNVGIYSFDYLRALCPCGTIDHQEERRQAQAGQPRIL